MIIQVTPREIPRFWGAIKFAAVKVEEVEEGKIAPFAVELLHALLNEKAQCFIRLSDDRLLNAITITRIRYNPQTDEKYLYVQCLYSWQIVDDGVWKRDMAFIKRFARSVGCVYIGALTKNYRAQDIMTNLGFEEEYRVYALKV